MDHVEDFVLANAPEYVASMREADKALREGRTRSATDLFTELDNEGDPMDNIAFPLDQLYGTAEAAEYLGIEITRLNWRTQRGTGPKADKVLASDYLYTRQTLDAWKDSTDYSQVPWPVYVGGYREQDQRWKAGRDSGFDQGIIPSNPMFARNPKEASVNATAWQTVADNWDNLAVT